MKAASSVDQLQEPVQRNTNTSIAMSEQPQVYEMDTTTYMSAKEAFFKGVQKQNQPLQGDMAKYETFLAQYPAFKSLANWNPKITGEICDTQKQLDHQINVSYPNFCKQLLSVGCWQPHRENSERARKRLHGGFRTKNVRYPDRYEKPKRKGQRLKTHRQARSPLPQTRAGEGLVPQRSSKLRQNLQKTERRDLAPQAAARWR